MKAALLQEPGKIEIRDDIPTPDPGKGEVLVRVRKAGVCGTDYSVFTGALRSPLPIIMGHEAVGEVSAFGKGTHRFRIGDRVVIQPNFACDKCELCSEGRKNICPHRTRLGIDANGVFAEYVNVPEQCLWAVPQDLSDEFAALVEPLAVAVHGVKKNRPSPGEKVLVYGTGVIGLLFVRVAVLAGGDVTAFDIAEPRLALAQRFGAERLIRSSSDLEERKGFSLIYETSGISEAFARSVRICNPGGRIVLAGIPEKESPVSTALIVRNELSVQGSMIYTDEFAGAIELLRTGKVDAPSLISKTYSLEELPRAFEEFRAPDRVKAIVNIP